MNSLVIYISTWNTSHVTNMSKLFPLKPQFNDIVSQSDVSSVQDMSYMFEYVASVNSILHTWRRQNVSNDRTMQGMFSNTGKFNQSLNDWNICHGPDFRRMFRDAVDIINKLMVH